MVLREFLTIVESHAPTERWRKLFHPLFHYSHGHVGLHTVGTTDADKTAFSLHQAHQRAASALADQGITFPVSVAPAPVDHFRPPIDPHTVGQFPPFFGQPTAATQQLLPARPSLPNPRVNCLPRQPAPLR